MPVLWETVPDTFSGHLDTFSGHLTPLVATRKVLPVA